MPPGIQLWRNSEHLPKYWYRIFYCFIYVPFKTFPLQMAMESQESCPFTQSTWRLTRKEIFLRLHLSPSASTRRTVAFWDKQDLRLTTQQFVTSFNQSTLKVNFVTHLILQRQGRSHQNQASQMDFSFCWIPSRMNSNPLQIVQVTQGLVNLSNFTPIHLHNMLHMDLGLMGWVFWRKWQEQKALSNFLTTRRNALFTTERNARLRITWIKFRRSVTVLLGLYRLTRAKIRWKPN